MPPPPPPPQIRTKWETFSKRTLDSFGEMWVIMDIVS
jgi:hypothetical protein